MINTKYLTGKHSATKIHVFNYQIDITQPLFFDIMLKILIN